MDSRPKPVFESFSPAELRQLYEKDPDLFNELAANTIDRACEGRTPEQTLKLKRMQWVIEAQLRKAKTPVERMHLMENIFYEQVYRQQGLLQQLAAGWASVLRAISASHDLPLQKPGLRLLKK